MMGVKRRQTLGLEVFYDSPESESCFYGRPILQNKVSYSETIQHTTE